MNPNEVYKLYLAIKLHFTKESYDVFEYRGSVPNAKMSASLNTTFSSIAHRMATPHDAVQYFVASFAYDSNIFEHQSAEDAYKRWKSNKERSTQLIVDDIESLIDRFGSIENCLAGDPCKLQSLLSGKHINIETAVALNRKYKFAESWKNNFAYKGLGVKIMKLDRFVKYREEKVNETLNYHVEETA